MKGLLFIAVLSSMLTVVACNHDDPIEDDSALTRGAGVNDSTDNTEGGIQVDTVWEESVTIGF